MKASEQYFPLVLFIMLYKVILTFSLRIGPKLCVTVMRPHVYYVV